jgi:hypothetical protein
LRILAERGYIIPAVNTEDTDYVMCARQLVRSLKAFHPEARVCLLTDTMIDDEYFDYIHLLPAGDQAVGSKWKLNNDWQVFGASPFRQTIKLEADMWVTSPIDHWWTLFEKHDVVISQGCRDFYDQPAASRYYRRIFDDNNLPDVYNGITYWRVSQTAKEFFNLVRELFENWDTHKKLLKFPDEIPTTDVVYAMAAVIMGPETITLPVGYGPTMVHMKRHIIGTLTDNWSDELVFEHTNPGLRINTVAQWGLFHYHIKDLNNE